MDELLTSFTMEKPNRESNPGTHGRHTGTSATLQRRPSPRTTATTRRHALRQLHGTASHAKRWPSSPSRSRPLMPNVRTGTSAALHPLILTQKPPSAGILNSAKENRGATEEKIDATAAKPNPRHECRRGGLASNQMPSGPIASLKSPMAPIIKMKPADQIGNQRIRKSYDVNDLLIVRARRALGSDSGMAGGNGQRSHAHMRAFAAPRAQCTTGLDVHEQHRRPTE